MPTAHRQPIWLRIARWCSLWLAVPPLPLRQAAPVARFRGAMVATYKVDVPQDFIEVLPGAGSDLLYNTRTTECVDLGPGVASYVE